jgi:predicted N-acetyltransferase YhbS
MLALHAALILLAVDPTFNRQGAGRALVQWGVERAASTNLPVFICASEQGERLYSALGFTVRKREHVTSKHILTTHMLKDPVAPDSDL